VTGPVNPERACEPDTVFEPAVSEEESAAADARRRGINLASHTGVGIAGAAGVLGVQRFGGTGEAEDTGAAGLDVFDETGPRAGVDPAGGVSANAEPVVPDESATPSQSSAPPPVEAVEQAMVNVDPVQNVSTPEPVEFLPADEDPAAETQPDMLADFSPDNEHDSQPELVADDVAPDATPRIFSLADAGTEIGGGITLDDVESADSLFGASGEFGVVVEDDPDDEGSDDSFASVP
jgi:hypothetical protein